jgi:hypothetical protein
MLDGRYVVLAGELGEVRQLVPIWQGYMIERFGVRMPVHVRLILGLQAKVVLDHIGYPASPLFLQCHGLKVEDARIRIGIWAVPCG